MPVAKETRIGQVPKTTSKRKPRPKVDFTPIPVVPKGKTPDSPKQAQRATYVRAEREKKQIAEIHRIAAMGPKERARYNFGGPAGAVPASPKARKQAVKEIKDLSNALKNLERLRGYDISERGRTAGLARAAADAERRRSSRRSSWLSDYAANLARGAGMVGEELWEKTASWKVPTVGAGSRFTGAGVTFGGVPLAATTVGPEAAKVVVPGLAKVGLAGAVGAGTLLTPGGAMRGGGEAVDMLSGLTQTLGMIETIAKPGDPAMKQQMIEGAVQATLDDIADRYGPDVTLVEAAKKGHEDPLISTLNAIAVAAPTAKVGSIGTYMRHGATLREARLLSRDPSREPEILGKQVSKPRTVTVRQEHGKTYPVEVSKSRSPIMRASGRVLYDPASRGLERVGGGRVYGVRALTPTKRGLRTEKRRLNREERRRRAAGHSLFREVANYLKDSPDMAARLTTILKKPEGVDEDEWMIAATDEILEMIEGREVITPESGTALEQKLRNRLERFRTKMERSHRDKWVGKLEDIEAEKTRLAEQIDSHDELITDAVDVIEELEAEPKTAANRKALREQRANLEVLVSRRDAWQEELDQWTIEETPVDSAVRTGLVNAIAQLPRVDEEQAEGLFQMWDARAREWGRMNDRDPGEWYGDPTGMGLSEIRMIEAGEIPEDVLAQGRRETEQSAYQRETERLEARAAELDQRWEQRVQTISEALFGKPSDRGKAETAKRNRERARLARKGINVPTVKRENFLEAETRVLRFLEEHADDPRFRLALSEVEERTRISEQLAALADRVLDELDVDGRDLTFEQRRVVEEEFDPTGGRVVHNVLHRPLVVELAAQEVRYAQIKKDHPITKVSEKTKEKNEEIREDAKAILDKAKEDELYARILYGSDTYKAGRNFPTNAARTSLVSNLIRKYKGRTNALPPNADTPRELNRLIALLDELTVRGRHARFWYEKSAKAIKQIAGGDRKLAVQIAQLVAIYSPQKAVIPNLGEALKAYYAHKAGLEITNGYDWQKVEAQKVLDGTGNWDGRKTNNFYLNFLEEIDKRFYNKERKLTEAERKKAVADGRLAEGATQVGEVTADMWMARVFGYLTKNVSDGRYDVIESIVRQLAEERGWKPKQVQAAIWTAIKDISDDVSANVDFEEAISRHHGFINLEVAPGSSFNGPFKAVYNSWSDETKAAFMLAHTKIFEEFLARAGILHRKAELGPGIFEREAAPGARLTLITSNSPIYKAPEADKQMYRFVAAAVGRATLQNAVPWLKGYIAKTKSAGDLTFVNLGRRATDDEAMALYQKLNPSHDIEDERVFVIHAGNEGLLLRKHPRFSAEARAEGWGSPDWLNFARADAEHAKTFQGVVEAAIADTLPDVAINERVVHHVAEGELLENDWQNGSADYDQELERAIGDRGGSPEAVRQRESADWLAGETTRLRDEFEADPDGSVERTYASFAPKRRRARAGVEPETARGPPEGTQPPETLSQTRQTELLGAVRFLNSEDGARILYLTEQADVSTLMHELIGHGVREMKASYPREFAAVEEHFGVPLEEWGTLEHERFAQMFERYLAEGRAPTVELVPTFGKLKTWMRAIYGGMKALGKPLPIEVTSLFDTYFGAFNDDNVFRIAQMMGRLPEENRLGYDQALFDFTSKELATLRRRNDTRAYNRSINGLEQRVRELARKEELTPDEEEEFAAKVAQYDLLRAQREYTEADRESKLRRRYAELEKAMAKPEGRAYEGALASLRALSDERETILRSVFGDQYDAVFANRKDLLANWLVDRGLLKADFQTGSARYVPDWPEAGKPPRQIKIPGRALTSRTVGKADPRMLTLHAKNNMILWQNGNLDTDPIVVFQAWQNAQAFAFIHGVKERLWEIGRPLQIDEPIPDNAYVINFNGVPVPAAQRAMLNAGGTHEAQVALDALEGHDTDAMDEALARYGNEILLEPKVAEALRAHDDTRWQLDLRVVDKDVVDALLRPLRGSSPIGTGWDMGTTLARWSLIYTNPAYIPVNLIGNFLFLSAASAAGPIGALYNMGKAARTMLRDPVLAIRIAGEAGELPAEAAISRGRTQAGRWRRTQEKEQKWLNRLTAIPDKWPRIAAWIMEAERLGYRTRDEKMKLLLAEDADTDRHRDLVSERTVEAMVNFDRLSDFERQFVTRVLFVWPWIRGATAWPFYYAREFPVRAAVAANVGLTMEERREELMGPVPLYRKGLFPMQGRYDSKTGKWIPPKGGKMQVIDPGPMSPTSTAAESIETVRSTILSILGQGEQERGTMVLDYFQPLLEMAYEIVGQQNAFGQKQTTRDTILDNALSFVPWGATISAAFDPSKVSAVFDERGGRDVFRRRFARTISSDTVDIARLNAQATKRGEKTTSEKIEEERDRLRKSVTKLGGSVTLDNSIDRAVAWKVAYQDARADLQKTLKEQRDYHPGPGKKTPTLNDLQEAWVAYHAVQRYAPAMAEGITTPDEIPDAMLEDYKDAIIYGSKEYKVAGLLQPITDFEDEVRKLKKKQEAK